ncbi:hypothetical protein MMC19_000352 [Ptychographa xylographoides]|nr:hypothetical protein [Ptychographa xylographoides]
MIILNDFTSIKEGRRRLFTFFTVNDYCKKLGVYKNWDKTAEDLCNMEIEEELLDQQKEAWKKNKEDQAKVVNDNIDETPDKTSDKGQTTIVTQQSQGGWANEYDSNADDLSWGNEEPIPSVNTLS